MENMGRWTIVFNSMTGNPEAPRADLAMTATAESGDGGQVDGGNERMDGNIERQTNKSTMTDNPKREQVEAP